MHSPEFSDALQSFSRNLRSLMEGHGLSGKALSLECGIPDASINRYLTCSRVPRLDNILILAKFFDVSVDWLVGLSEEKDAHWPQKTREIARLYSMATQDDRAVIDAVLKKYKEE